jgi:hypothetical protein
MGPGNTVSILTEPAAIREALKQLLRYVHPDRVDSHPSVSFFGGMKNAPYFVRRKAEARFVFLREVAKAVYGILDSWKASEDRKERGGQGSGKSRRKDRRDKAAVPTEPAAQAASTDAAAAAEPFSTLVGAGTVGDDSWGDEPTATEQPSGETVVGEESAQEPVTTTTEAQASVEEIADVEAPAPQSPAKAAVDSVSLELQLEAVRTTLADETLLPNKRKFYIREERRILDLIAKAKAPAAPKAEKPKREKRGLGALKELAGKSDSEE